MPSTSNLFVHSIRDVTIVEVSERTLLDSYRIQQLAGELYELVDVRNVRKLVLDLTKLRRSAPALVTVLLTLKRKISEIKGEAVLCGLQPEVKRLAMIADLHKQFRCYNDEEGALRAFGITTAG